MYKDILWLTNKRYKVMWKAQLKDPVKITATAIWLKALDEELDIIKNKLRQEVYIEMEKMLEDE